MNSFTRIVSAPAHHPGVFLLDVLLFPVSFSLHMVLRTTFALLGQLSIRRLEAQGKARRWQVFNERLQERLVIAYLLSFAPRWNTEALIATTEPFRATESISIDTRALAAAGFAWYLVIYRSPHNRAEHTITGPVDDPAIEVPVKPGTYVVTLRIYRPAADIVFPAIDIDGNRSHVESRRVSSASLPTLQETIFNRRTLFYDLLHRYMLSALRYPHLFTQRFLNHAYLPVGNEENLYVFGFLSPKYQLELTLDETVTNRCMVFLSCYNSSSFPKLSIEITRPGLTQIPTSKHEGTFLLRIIPVRIATAAHLLNGVQVNHRSRP